MGDVLMLTPVIRELYHLHDGEIIIDVATHAKNVSFNSFYIARVLDPDSLCKSVRMYDVVIDLNLRT